MRPWAFVGFLYNICHANRNIIIARILLKTMLLPQSAGKKYGGIVSIGSARIIKNPIL
jgi:hypothetical protein